MRKHFESSSKGQKIEDLIKVDEEKKMDLDWRSVQDKEQIDDEQIKERLRLDFAAAERYLSRDIDELTKKVLKDPFILEKSSHESD